MKKLILLTLVVGSSIINAAPKMNEIEKRGRRLEAIAGIIKPQNNPARTLPGGTASAILLGASKGIEKKNERHVTFAKALHVVTVSIDTPNRKSRLSKDFAELYKMDRPSFNSSRQLFSIGRMHSDDQIEDLSKVTASKSEE
jgi:hypothetical protein